MIDEKKRKITVGGKTFTHKDTISIDGSTGEVYGAIVRLSRASPVTSAR
ncbi:MAG: hypothetical protein R3B96_24615 [Pirellulaceae bacterium]